MQTSDIHGHLLAYDYANNRLFERRGLARTALQIAAARRAEPLNLLLDSGDFLQGSPIADRLAQTPGCEPQNDHPVISAMNALHYDAVTLGNHDLDFGLDHLAQALKQANFPVVSANLCLPAAHPLAAQLKPFVVLERQQPDMRHPLRIGVTGVLPQSTLAAGAHPTSAISCAPIVPALETTLAAMRAEGADLCIVLAHCAYDSLRPETRAALQHADLLLLGHTHTVCPPPGRMQRFAPGAHTPKMITGAWGEYLGQADLSLRLSAAHWQITETALRVTRTPPNAPECPKMREQLTPDHQQTLAALSRPLGETTQQIDSFFALVQDNAGLQLVAEAFASHLRDALQGTQPEPLPPLLAAVAPFRAGGHGGAEYFCHIPKGTLNTRDLDKLYSFHDTLCAVSITGKALRAWLEMSASLFCQVSHGAQDSPLHDPAFPCYLFDVIPQLDYEIDLSKPALFTHERKRVTTAQQAGRIAALKYQGKPVEDDSRFVLATSSHRAKSPWPDLPGTEPPALLLDTGVSCRSVLARHIKARGTIAPIAHPSWRFKPMVHSSALFLTSPTAQSCPAQGIDFIRHTPEGFAQMRLRLAGTGRPQALANPEPEAYIEP